VILDNLPADVDRPGGAIALTGADEVYVATGGTANPSADRLLAGKILRLNADGTVPRDAPAASPVYADAVDEPLAVGINPLSGRPWVLSGRRTGPTSLEFVTSPRARAALQYRGDLLSGFKNELLVAGADGLERLRFDVDHSTWIGRERVISGPFGKLGAVAEGADGALYVATANAASTGTPGIDCLLRIVPDREPARRRR
jgi:glucose/arabinose dehydrogenase